MKKKMLMIMAVCTTLLLAAAPAYANIIETPEYPMGYVSVTESNWDPTFALEGQDFPASTPDPRWDLEYNRGGYEGRLVFPNSEFGHTTLFWGPDGIGVDGNWMIPGPDGFYLRVQPELTNYLIPSWTRDWRRTVSDGFFPIAVVTCPDGINRFLWIHETSQGTYELVVMGDVLIE